MTRNQAPLRTRLIALADKRFSRVTTGDCKRSDSYRIRDCLMCALAIFDFKMPSMLKFDQATAPGLPLAKNLDALYGVAQAPSDTTLRRRLDAVDPACVHAVLRTTFGWLREHRKLDRYRVAGRRIPIALDGSGYFTSTQVQCDHCLKVKARDGLVHHRHGVLAAAVVHPDHPAGLPVAAEAIVRGDVPHATHAGGAPQLKSYATIKNDCELNAAKRLVPRLAREHRGTKFLVIGDALFANEPMVKLLRSQDMRFVLTLKDSRHAHAFKALAGRPLRDVPRALGDDQAPSRLCRYAENVELNKSKGDICKVNVVEVLEYVAVGDTVKENRWTYATDLPVRSPAQAREIMRLGRSRWRIENAVFKTLKDDDGYHLEHNYGHGKRHLCTLMMLMMLVALLFDRICEYDCAAFRKAKTHWHALRSLWEGQRGVLRFMPVADWQDFYARLAFETSVTD